MISQYLLTSGSLLFALAPVVVAHGQTFKKSGEPFKGDVLDSWPVTDSLIHCATKCELSSKCRVVQFHVVNFTCVLYENYILIPNMTKDDSLDVVTYFKEPRLYQPGWSIIGDSCYIGVNMLMSWIDAFNACNSWGAGLATLTSQVENDAAINVRVDPKRPVWKGGKGIANGTHHEWQWVNGEGWEFENFAHREPNFDPHMDACLAIHGDKTKWYDRDCRQFKIMPFICEKKIPE